MLPPSVLVTGFAALAGLAAAGCPYADPANLKPRQDDDGGSQNSRDFMTQYEVDDSDGFMTTDVGGPIEDQDSLRAGERGPTLLEDFIFRQKITRFDHERIPERAVHARGAGAFGTFTSYGDFRNVTAASFLAAEGKETPVFVRFSTVAGSRGSADTARDVHGFATRFYTDEGNFDIVGNNIPVFFIQDAIRFPDLIHSVKPMPDREIPQAATAHDSAWDFFSQQPSVLHTLFWAMAGHGIPRSYRMMDGFGVHAFRLVNDDGDATIIKWHWKTLQGKASLVWEEAQHVSGMNPDFHRQDLWDAIEAGNGPEWELNVQMLSQEQADGLEFDILDPTKIVPVEIAPLHKLGKMKLDANPVNYFSETEQIMFQPGHIVRGVDFTDDPLLQGRIFSYLDTQLNRHGGPNFEQIPINRPVTRIHNNNRDGAGQMFIHRNTAAYTPNTLNNGVPAQANQTTGRGFFTTPSRSARGNLVRKLPSSFDDHWSQPRLFYNSLSSAEKQALVNAIRFETSNLKSAAVKSNVLVQLNRVSNSIARLVAVALGMDAPAADPTYYHDNTTTDVGSLGYTLSNIRGLRVGLMVTDGNGAGRDAASNIRNRLAEQGIVAQVISETLANGADATYSAADATAVDALVLLPGSEALVNATEPVTLFPNGKPKQLLTKSFAWGKPVGFVGSARAAAGDEIQGSGVFVRDEDDVAGLVQDLVQGLKTFKFVDRFAVDEGL